MYSQSKGRHFGIGQHQQLLEYLVQSCPLHPGADWQEDKKLNLILSKVQEHQSSLRTVSVISPTEGKRFMPSCHFRHVASSLLSLILFAPLLIYYLLPRFLFCVHEIHWGKCFVLKDQHLQLAKKLCL